MGVGEARGAEARGSGTLRKEKDLTEDTEDNCEHKSKGSQRTQRIKKKGLT